MTDDDRYDDDRFDAATFNAEQRDWWADLVAAEDTVPCPVCHRLTPCDELESHGYVCLDCCHV